MGRRKKPNFGTLGERGRAVMGWLEDLDAAAVQDNLPMCFELATWADQLAEVRAELRAPGLTIMDRTHLRTQEARASEGFRKSWTALGLTVDTGEEKKPRPLGRPPEFDRVRR
jgi:hypothetical protein